MAATLLFGAAGCDPYGDYCTARIDCVGGNDQDEEVCEIQADLAEERADILGCIDDYDALFECLEENETCNGEEWSDGGKCASQQEAYTKCTQ